MDLSQVTLSQMRYAVAVADTRSFREAADRSHVSQSGLSMQIQKLEELLGAVLFDRSKKPVRLTPDGEGALRQMRVVLRETERLGQLVADQGEPSGSYRLGIIPTLAPSILPLFLRELLDRYARIELTVEELKTEEIIARLQAESLDAGIAATPLEVAGIHETPLGVEPLYAYLPAGDPLLKRKSISESQLQERELWVMADGHCFRTQVLALCEVRDERRVHFESGSFESLMRLVDEGVGATVIPALVVHTLTKAKRDAHVRPLSAPVPVREIGLVTSRTELRRQINEAVADIIQARLAGRLGAPPRRPRIVPPV